MEGVISGCPCVGGRVSAKLWLRWVGGGVCHGWGPPLALFLGGTCGVYESPSSLGGVLQKVSPVLRH